MHYNFIESQGSPTSDPLTLWQQGGPGSSGFGYGYMAELGPFHLSDESMANVGPDGIPALWQNPYSWDKLSNVLILEHPPGTGFSYCADANGTVATCKWNDETQAEAFLMEIEGWFSLFPEYKDHEFYLTGESYAGLLLPNLMHQIATKPNSINLKAAAIVRFHPVGLFLLSVRWPVFLNGGRAGVNRGRGEKFLANSNDATAGQWMHRHAWPVYRKTRDLQPRWRLRPAAQS